MTQRESFDAFAPLKRYSEATEAILEVLDRFSRVEQEALLDSVLSRIKLQSAWADSNRPRLPGIREVGAR